MIDYINGAIVSKTPTEVVIDTHGIGYKIYISLFTFSKIQNLDSVKLLTYFQIKEDSHSLYGFFDNEERFIFLNLISVSGVGANTARLMLSSLSPIEIFKIITTSNVVALEKVKGIGKKTAERIIVELKDKLLKHKTLNTLTTSNFNHENESNVLQSAELTEKYNMKNDAVLAMSALGIQRHQAETIIHKILESQPQIKTIEELIKQSLKALH